MRRAADFRHALKRGRRATAQTMVVHAAPGPGGVRVGLAVNRAVGGAVVRNRVKRRLRHAVRSHLPALEQTGPWDVVVRALPTAASADFDELSGDLARCLAAFESVPA
jgi:ribonuclease P protein component